MKKLQEEFPEFDFYTLEGCFNELNWEYEKDNHEYNNITCDCGGEVKAGGWFGNEHAWCPDCGKGMQDFTAFLPSGMGTAGIINHAEYDFSDNKVWVPENMWNKGDE